MPIFEYKGLSKTGKNVRGTLDSDNIRTARTKLKKDGIFVVELRDKTKALQRNKKKTVTRGGVSTDDLAMMTRQLATLLKANIPLVEALNATADQVEQPVLKEAVADVKNLVNEGSAFYKGLAK